MNGIDKLDVNTLFKMSTDSRTRGHNFKIVVKQILTCLGVLSMLLSLGVETVRNTSFHCGCDFLVTKRRTPLPRLRLLGTGEFLYRLTPAYADHMTGDR